MREKLYFEEELYPYKKDFCLFFSKFWSHCILPEFFENYRESKHYFLYDYLTQENNLIAKRIKGILKAKYPQWKKNQHIFYICKHIEQLFEASPFFLNSPLNKASANFENTDLIIKLKPLTTEAQKSKLNKVKKHLKKNNFHKIEYE